MFKLVEDLIVTWPVRVDLGHGDKPVWSEKFNVTFKVLRDSQLQEADAAGGWKPVLRRSIQAWDGIADTDGKPLPFTPENLERVLEIPRVLAALMQGFASAGAGAREKN